MATVRWINIQTGEVKWGAEDLYRKGESPWVPACRVKMPDGSIRENTLNSFYLWIDRNFAMINLDNTKSIGMISISGVTMDVAQKELFYTGVNLYSYLMAEPSFPVIQVTYKPSPVTNWPDRNTWIEALKTDDDTTDETDKTDGGGNNPKPGRPKPRTNPFTNTAQTIHINRPEGAQESAERAWRVWGS